jgi:protein-L-isoaspartate(D-aspartate) O-methyltransferase
LKRGLALLVVVCIPALAVVALAATQADKGNASPAAAAPEEPASAEAAAPAEEAPPVWDRPRFEERKDERLELVGRYIEGHGIKDKAVLEAMREVPRHLFVTSGWQKEAYGDYALPIAYGQTISQPYIVAFMTELLALKPGAKVLEIGTGSGYQAAVLAELTPCVYTIEIIHELAEQAAKRLDKLGYKTVKTKEGDGYYGWKEDAPFDAIIVTAAAGHVPLPLLEQLKPGGRIVIPIGQPFETQQMVVVSKGKDGQVRDRTVLPVVFVPMTGRVQEGK